MPAVKQVPAAPTAVPQITVPIPADPLASADGMELRSPTRAADEVDEEGDALATVHEIWPTFAGSGATARHR